MLDIFANIGLRVNMMLIFFTSLANVLYMMNVRGYVCFLGPFIYTNIGFHTMSMLILIVCSCSSIFDNLTIYRIGH